MKLKDEAINAANQDFRKLQKELHVEEKRTGNRMKIIQTRIDESVRKENEEAEKENKKRSKACK